MGRRCHVLLFGRTRVSSPEGEPVRVPGKPGRILAVLGLRLGQPVTKDHLAELVWQGSPPSSYRQTLESDVCVVRRRSDLGTGRGSALATVSGGYLLDPEKVDVDLHLASRLARGAGTSSAGEVLAALDEVSGMTRDPLLADEPFTDWADQPRQEWAATWTHLLVRASRAALVSGDSTRAVRLAERALDEGGTTEESATQLMRAYWWRGQHNEALRVYARLRTRLLEELGQQPGRDAVELYLAILRDDGFERSAHHDGEHLRLLLALLRGALDFTPGVVTPALDSQLVSAATAVLRRDRPA